MDPKDQNNLRLPQKPLWLACQLYDEYCAAVGGFAFNGDRLPSWSAFRADPSKLKQSDAWIAVAEKALKVLSPYQ